MLRNHKPPRKNREIRMTYLEQKQVSQQHQALFPAGDHETDGLPILVRMLKG